MALKTWNGGASTRAQVDTFTITGAGLQNDVWTLTVTAEDGSTTTVTYTDEAGPTTQKEVTGLVAAWEASTHKYCTGIAAADDGDPDFTLTASTAGTPFSVALTHSAGGTSSKASTVVNGGPYDYNDVNNWLEGAIPGAADDVLIAAGASNIRYGLDQSGVAVDRFDVEDGYTGQIGDESIGYLKIDPDDFNFAGTGQAWINTGSAATNSHIIFNTAAPSAGYGLYLLHDTLGVPLTIYKGNVGFGINPSGATILTTVYVNYTTNRDSDVTLDLKAATLTTLNVTGGTVSVEVATTTINQWAGTLTTQKAMTITTANIMGGTFVSNASGTIGTLNANGGTCDFRRDSIARTVTDLAHRGDAIVLLDPDVVTVTNAITSTGILRVTNDA